MRNSNILKDDSTKHIVGNLHCQENFEENDNEYLFRLWLRDGNVVNEIRKYLDKLETAVILIEVDYVDILGLIYQGNKNSRLFEQCYNSYVTLDGLVNDLKNIRMNLDNTSNH